MASPTTPPPLTSNFFTRPCPTLETDWQLGCMKLKQRLSHLLQSGQWSDCTFLVGSEPNRATIKAHKLILACASPVFEAMFFGCMAEKDRPIEILDVQPEAFKTLLQYIYTDKTEINSFEKACSVYYSAKKYMLPYLEKECTWYISLNLNPQNVCRAYELAQLFDEKLLMDECIKIMVTRTKEVINDESFEEAEISTILTLLDQEDLCIESELDLFKAIEKYANIHSCMKRRRSFINNETQTESPPKKPKRDSLEMGEALCNLFETSQVPMELEPTKDVDKDSEPVPSPEVKISDQQGLTVDSNKDIQNKTTDTNNNDETNNLTNSFNSSIVAPAQNPLREALCKIRFLTLTPQEFAGGPARSTLLTESEAFAILLNILSRQASPVPMPSGFSTCVLTRNQPTVSQEELNSKSEIVFRFTVLNFKSRRRSVESRAFTFLDMQWCVRLVPRIETDTSGQEKKYFGLFLKCSGRAEAWSAGVVARVKLVPRDARPHAAPIAADIRRTFNNKDFEWGFTRFVTWDDVTNPERGLLRNNSITIEAHIYSE